MDVQDTFKTIITANNRGLINIEAISIRRQNSHINGGVFSVVLHKNL